MKHFEEERLALLGEVLDVEEEEVGGPGPVALQLLLDVGLVPGHQRPEEGLVHPPGSLQAAGHWFRMKSTLGYKSCSMDGESLSSFNRKRASIRTCLVSGFSTELLEIESEEPYLNVLFIPGNPGIVSFYKDFVEVLYEQLEGKASITVIGHISHSNKDFAFGRLFSLQEQINHKVGFIKGLQNKNLPIILVGHSIGSYVCMDVLKSFPEQLSEEPEWRFIVANKKQIAFLFGVDDHWGPLSLFEEVPGIAMSIEREGHTHGFCCTESGSTWVARHVANLISNQVQIQNEANKPDGGDGNSNDDFVKAY